MSLAYGRADESGLGKRQVGGARCASRCTGRDSGGCASCRRVRQERSYNLIEQVKCQRRIAENSFVIAKTVVASPSRCGNDSPRVGSALLSTQLSRKRGRFVGEVLGEHQILRADRIVGLADEALGRVV